MSNHDTSRRRVSEIEDAIAQGQMSAPEVFTKMRELLNAAQRPSLAAPGVDVVALADSLVDQGRIIERYRDPRLQPLSEQNFRSLDSAYREVLVIKRKLAALNSAAPSPVAASGGTPKAEALRLFAGKLAFDEERELIYGAAEKIDELERELAEARANNTYNINRADSWAATAKDLKSQLAHARSATGALQDDVPLKCEVVNGSIQFVIGEKVLAHAVNICPALYDGENDRGLYKVTDPAAFAKELVRTLNHESEDGSTRLTTMLDEAVEHAIEYGAEGIEENAPVDGGAKP